MTIKKLCLCALSIIAAIFTLLSCHRSDFSRSLPPNVDEVKTWLHANGGFLKNEKYTIKTTSGTELTGILSWDRAQKYTWRGNAYLDVPITFDGDYEITGTGVSARTSFNLVLRRKGESYEGAVRTTLFGSMQMNLSGGIDDIATIQTYQLLDGREGNVWQSNDDLTNPRALLRRSFSPQQIMSMRASTKQQEPVTASGTVRRSVTDEVCETKTTTSYQTYCWYATPAQEANQHATCSSQPVTVSYQECKDTTPILPPTGSGGGGGTTPPPPSFPPGGQGGGTSTATDPDCANAASNNAIATELLKTGSYLGSAPNSDVVTSVNAFATLAQQPFTNIERSISLAYRAQFDLNLARPVVTTSTTPMVQGTSNGVQTTTRYSNDSVIVVGGIHNHIASSFPAPSARDVYQLFTGNQSNSAYRYQFNFANDGSRYLISITTAAAFNSFTSSYSESQNVNPDHGWNRNSTIGKDFKWAESYFKDVMGQSANEAYQNAHAYVLNKYTGTTLSKYNPSTQRFESIRPVRVIKPKLDPVTNQTRPDTSMQLRSGC